MASISVFRARSKARPPIRQPLNCTLCRHLKQKCDRQLPCSTCRRRNTSQECTYSSSRTQPNTTHSAIEENDALRARIEALEHALSQSDAGIAKEAAEAPNALLDSTSSTDDCEANVFDDQQSTSSMSSICPPTTGIVNPSADRTRPFSDHGSDALCGPQPTRMSDVLASLSKQSIPFQAIGSGETNSVSLFDRKSKNEVQELLVELPRAITTDMLLSRYFAVFSPLFHVLHDPSFRMEYGAFLRSKSDVDLSWLALLFVLLALAVTTLEDNDMTLDNINTHRGRHDSRASLAAQYRTVAMKCLAADNFLVRHNLHTLQALVLLIYATNHSEGSSITWPLLGLTVNVAIALRCHLDSNRDQHDYIVIEQSRRCWAALLMLHTIQAVSFDNVDIESLARYSVRQPLDVNDVDIELYSVNLPSTSPTQMSYMLYKFRLYRLSARICEKLNRRTTPKGYEDTMDLDHEVAAEQRLWDDRYLADGGPGRLEAHNQAQWNILHMYANQLYLLLHRPFFRFAEQDQDLEATVASIQVNETWVTYQAASQARCVTSGKAILDIYKSFCEVGILKPYRWFRDGLGAFYATHGAVALAAHLMNTHKSLDEDTEEYFAAFQHFIGLFQQHSFSSPIGARALPVLLELQSRLPKSSVANPHEDLYGPLGKWSETRQWIAPSTVTWDAWAGISAHEQRQDT